VSEPLTTGVQAMVSDDPHAATCGLTEFLMAYEKDDNIWWMVACGHHQNLFEAAVERIEELENQYGETP
jgi:hypothetical protein